MVTGMTGDLGCEQQDVAGDTMEVYSQLDSSLIHAHDCTLVKLCNY